MVVTFWTACVAGLFGLLIGSVLNAVVWRTSRRESLLSTNHCSNCDTTIRLLHNVAIISWITPHSKCVQHPKRISARYLLVELGTAIAFATFTWWFATWSVNPTVELSLAWCIALIAYLWFAAVSIALTLIDVQYKRLPDAIVLPSLAVVLVLLSTSSVLTADWSKLFMTLGAAGAMFMLYFVIALVYPFGIGGGDVKLAPLLGAVLGFIGWTSVAVGVFSGFLFGAFFGVSLLILRKATHQTSFPFGPFMLLGAWFGIVFGEMIVQPYLELQS